MEDMCITNLYVWDIEENHILSLERMGKVKIINGDRYYDNQLNIRISNDSLKMDYETEKEFLQMCRKLYRAKGLNIHLTIETEKISFDDNDPRKETEEYKNRVFREIEERLEYLRNDLCDRNVPQNKVIDETIELINMVKSRSSTYKENN